MADNRPSSGSSGERPGNRTKRAGASSQPSKRVDPQGDDPRKITYQVGWRSGTIRVQEKAESRKAQVSGGTLSDFRSDAVPGPEAPAREESGGAPRKSAGERKGAGDKEQPASAAEKRPASAAESADAPAAPASAGAAERFAALLFRPAPQPTWSGWRAALAALPVVSFAALIWLAYRLGA